MRRTALLLFALLVVLAGCTVPSAPPPAPPPPPGPPTTLRVLAGSELADLGPILADAERATGVHVELTYTGTLDGAQTVAEGGADGVYDALWFSSTRYLETIPEARSRLAGSARIMGSPVVLGLRQSVAARLGWDRNPVTWADIADAAGRGEFTFAMTDPAASNTGFSALVAMASALDGSGNVLDAAAIERVAEPLTRLFSAQRLSAGSSGWLADAFVRRATGVDRGEPLDGLINYEGTLIGLNRSGTLPEPLTLIYPTDGVVSADYPLTVLASAPQPARDAHARLADHLRTPDVQRAIVEQTARRPAVPGTAPPAGVPDGLVELPFPDNRPALDTLLDAYADQLRRPARVVYVLDTSGSMEGARLDALKRALVGLTGVDDSLSGRFCRFRSREEVILLPFAQTPGQPQTFTIDQADPQRSRDQVGAAVNALSTRGDTAVFDSLIAAHEYLNTAPDQDRFATIVLMTDGESNVGATIDDYARLVASRLGSNGVAVFPILFGEAVEDQMRRVAELTGGQWFDARNGDLGQAFCEIRGYQ